MKTLLPGNDGQVGKELQHTLAPQNEAAAMDRHVPVQAKADSGKRVQPGLGAVFDLLRK